MHWFYTLAFRKSFWKLKENKRKKRENLEEKLEKGAGSIWVEGDNEGGVGSGEEEKEGGAWVEEEEAGVGGRENEAGEGIGRSE